MSGPLAWTNTPFLVSVGLWTVLLLAFGYNFHSQLDEPLFPGLSVNPGQPRKITVTGYPEHFPVSSYEPLPEPEREPLPRVQHVASKETTSQTEERLKRRDAVKQTMQRCWVAYIAAAWGEDELGPVSNSSRNTYGGLAVTIVDTLDTLYLMGIEEEYKEAVEYALKLDFTSIPTVILSTFEATIRYLGGFLAAYDLTSDPRLLKKAEEVADLLYVAFDTPNRLPVPALDWQYITEGNAQVASEHDSIAGLGSLTLEFTHLAQVTGNAKWYDAPSRIMKLFAASQNATRLPGMWSAKPVNAATADLHTGDGLFHLGGDSDSHYEYLLKMHILLGGSRFYEDMYRSSMKTAITALLFRPMLEDSPDVLLFGQTRIDEDGFFNKTYRADHLACFAGGLLGLGAQLLNEPSHADLGMKVTKGCIEMYAKAPLGIMPDESFVLPCLDCRSDHDVANCCVWNPDIWLAACNVTSPEGQRPSCPERLESGILSTQNAEYKLRPEALESIFVLYRITGDRTLQAKAWEMFEAISKYTRTEVANSAILDVMDKAAPRKDEMESFWFAETLKYLYLIFSEVDLVSLDEWVFNTEGHPFRRVHAASSTAAVV